MKTPDKAFGFILTIVVVLSCENKPAGPPVISTIPAIEISTTSVVSGGIISNDGGVPIISKGVCWNTTTDPTIDNNKTVESGQSLSFTSNIYNLMPGTGYYVRAYADNSAGISYGKSLYFKTLGGKPASNAQNASNIQLTTATLNGTVNSSSLETTIIFEYGLSTSYGSTVVAQQSPLSGDSNENVTADLVQLTPGTTYHYRITATNILGTTYGSDKIFSTDIADIEGNYYNTITIGNQLWMAENLRSTNYNDGTSIPLLEDNNQWGSAATAAYCWRDNDIGNKNVFGALYNWFAVDPWRNGHKNVCPAGWHVPKKSEWAILFNYLSQNGYGFAGDSEKIAKSLASTSGWETAFSAGMVGNDQATNNSSGFNGFPVGLRLNDGSFSAFGLWGGWWAQPDDYSAYNLWYIIITNNSSMVVPIGLSFTYGSSIRCLKN